MSRQLTDESQLPSQEGNKTRNYFNYTASPELPAIVLGGGYSSDRQMATFVTCLNKGNITSNGEAKSSVLFGDSRSFSEFESDLSVDVSTSASRNLFSVDASASYARPMKDTDYTQSFYFTYKINFPTRIFNPSGYGTDALNELGKGVYQEGVDRFREICGDQYVQQVILGAGLYVTLKIYFDSLSHKNQFNAKFGTVFGNIFDVSNKISLVVNKTQIEGNVEFYALQSGGDVTQLAKIFTVGPNPYSISSCSLKNMIACKDSINAILFYAANEFPKQINFTNEEFVGGVTSVGYVLAPFPELGLNVGETMVTKNVAFIRDDLGRQYQGLKIYQHFNDHILHHKIFNLFDHETRFWLKNSNGNLQYNIDLLKNPVTGVLTCYYMPQKCDYINNYVQQWTRPIEDMFQKVRNSYLITVTVYKEAHNRLSKIVVDQDSCIALEHDIWHQPATKNSFMHLYEWNCRGIISTLNMTRSSSSADVITLIYANHTYNNIIYNADQFEIKTDCNKPDDPILPPFNEHCKDELDPREPPNPSGILHTYVDMILQPIGLV